MDECRCEAIPSRQVPGLEEAGTVDRVPEPDSPDGVLDLGRVGAVAAEDQVPGIAGRGGPIAGEGADQSRQVLLGGESVDGEEIGGRGEAVAAVGRARAASAWRA